MKRIGIIGSRRRNTFEDFKLTYEAFLKVYRPGDIIVSGGCKEGGDRFAEIISCIGVFIGNAGLVDKYRLAIESMIINGVPDTERGSMIPIIIHYPDKSQLPPKPKRWDFAKINYARNTLIADESTDLLACRAADLTGGTEDTIKKFLKQGKTTLTSV